jgi:hypothetical protein
MRTNLACVLLMTVATTGTLQREKAQELLKCGSARVQYTPFDASYSGRIQIKTSIASDLRLSSEKKVFSTQHTRWLAEAVPDTMKPGPWTTRVYVGADDSDPNVELSFVDESNGGVDARWLNEKLIFGEVWWGRIYATDFIFDVEQRKFIYREMAHFDELMEPCR